MPIGLKGNTDGSGAIQIGGSDAISISTGLNTTFAGTITSSTGTTYPVVSSTAVTISGTSTTSVDFTSIPSWVKRITVMVSGVSLTTTASNVSVRIGSGSFEATGYVGGFGLSNSAAAANAAATTTEIALANLTNAADTVHGALVITNVTGNLWVAQGSFFRDSAATDAGFMVAASKTTSGVLDRVQVMLNSTGAFDAGTINILYE